MKKSLSPELEASAKAAREASSGKERDREDQSWKENIERSPCLNYRCYAGTEQNPVEVFHDPVKSDILSITDPLKLDDAYARLQSTLVVQSSAGNGKARPESSDLSPQRQRPEKGGEHARDSKVDNGINSGKERDHVANTNASSSTKGSSGGNTHTPKSHLIESAPEKKSTAKKSTGANSKSDSNNANASGPSTRHSKQQQQDASQWNGKSGNNSNSNHAPNAETVAEKSVKSTKKEKTKPQVGIENLSISRIMDDV